MHYEKEAVLGKREAVKEAALQKQHARALKALAQNQKIELRQLRIKHETKVGSSAGSKSNSKPHSRFGSGNSSKLGSAHGSDVISHNGKGSAIPRALAVEEEVEEYVEGEDDLQNEFGTLQASLLVLAKRHKEETAALEANIKKELNDTTLASEIKLADLEETQNNARVKLIEDQERDIEELKHSHEKEIMIEEMMVCFNFDLAR